MFLLLLRLMQKGYISECIFKFIIMNEGLGWYSCSGTRLYSMRYYVKTRHHCRELGGKCCWGGPVRRAVQGSNDYCGSCYDGEPLMEYCQKSMYIIIVCCERE